MADLLHRRRRNGGAALAGAVVRLALHRRSGTGRTHRLEGSAARLRGSAALSSAAAPTQGLFSGTARCARKLKSSSAGPMIRRLPDLHAHVERDQFRDQCPARLGRRRIHGRTTASDDRPDAAQSCWRLRFATQDPAVLLDVQRSARAPFQADRRTDFGAPGRAGPQALLDNLGLRDGRRSAALFAPGVAGRRGCRRGAFQRPRGGTGGRGAAALSTATVTAPARPVPADV